MMMFACLTAPAAGGATAVADATAVLNALPATWSDRFEREGWMLVRNYNDEIGSSCAEAFGTADRGRGGALLPGQRDRVRVAARRRAAHPAAAQRDRPAPGHRALLLVQPDRVPQRVDAGTGRARVPGGRLRRRRAALQHPVRQRRPDRRGHRPAAQQRVRGAHAPRAVAARRPAAGGQHPQRARPRALRRAARGARRDGRPGERSPPAAPTTRGEPRDEPPCPRRSR